jgi:hypothetical protein
MLTQSVMDTQVNNFNLMNNMAQQFEWDHIDTAPKDGTQILVCTFPNWRYLPICVRWRNYHPNAKGKECWRDHAGNKVIEPTHWMPEPEPPKLN